MEMAAKPRRTTMKGDNDCDPATFRVGPSYPPHCMVPTPFMANGPAIPVIVDRA